MRKRPVRWGPGTAYAATVYILFIFSFLAFHIFFPAAAAPNSGEGEKSIAPNPEISSLSGRLDLDSPSAVAVMLFNNVSDRSDQVTVQETAFDPARAIGITAELAFDDDRIRVLSAPQMAGSLAAGENTTVQFMALAEGAEVGIYPARLRLNYSRLEGISTSGEDNAPYIIFNYENLSRELPLPVKVVLGPRIQIEEVKGSAVPGKESILEVIVENSGDEPAFGLKIKARSMPPFILAEAEEERKETGQDKEVNLYPGDWATLHFAISTDSNATRGDYPLPCTISYLVSPPGQEGDLIGWGSEREENIALIVMVREESYLEGWIPLLIFLFVIIILAASYIYFQRNGSGSPCRNRRLRKSLKS